MQLFRLKKGSFPRAAVPAGRRLTQKGLNSCRKRRKEIGKEYQGY